ncbi:MAG: hypothetical protein KDA78_00580 [Planctomycetaceae bacterium]|nr:hypothetical protein [Planctomycetaceae bacterium]
MSVVVNSKEWSSMRNYRSGIVPVYLLVLTFPLLLVGCLGSDNKENSSETGKSGKDIAKSPVVENANREIVQDWTRPALSLILTGEQHGYMEPCGCSETQSGGISRRADLFRQLREDKGWEVVGIELGDLVKRSRTQDRIKYDVMYDALTTMGYQTLSLGPSDLQLSIDHLYSKVPNSTSAETVLPFVTSNVYFYGTKDLGSPAAYRVIEANGVKVGVTGFLGESFSRKLLPEGGDASALVTFADPVASVKEALAALQQEQCDFLLLLAQGSASEVESLVKAVPEFQVCVSAGGPEDPNGLPEQVGTTLVLEVGRKGKYAGVLGYYPEEGKKFRFELVDLDKERFRRTPAMEEFMQVYQDLLQQQDIVGTEPAAPHPSGQTFVGAEKCGTCHTKAYEKWKSSKHGHATETLVSGREGYQEVPWISRIHDPECLCCHTVGWNAQDVFRYEGGFISLEQTPHLAGQGCENCHGPGSHHTELELKFKEDRQSTPEVVAAREAIKVNLVTAEKQVCNKCHDFENSPKFNFQKYWEKVLHRGKD